MGATLVAYLGVTQALTALVPRDSLFVFWAVQWLFALGNGLFYGSLFGALSELVPIQIRASLVALALFAWEGIGVSLAQTLAGKAIDTIQKWPGMGHRSSLLSPESLRFGPITIVSLFACVPVGFATLVFFFWSSRYDRDRDALHALIAKH